MTFVRIVGDSAIAIGSVSAIGEHDAMVIEAMLGNAYCHGRNDKALQIRDALGIGVEP